MKQYETRILPALQADALSEAARFLRAGELVGFPTETVYGLGANATDAQAVLRIFEAKGRPADNPLIVHIASLKDLRPLVKGSDSRAKTLADHFWPGPLTMIFQRSAIVPSVVSAGLDTIAVRFPAHKAAQALILAAGCPIAAPSANRSGKPSPTTAGHVFEDMNGRIPLILDGGPCSVGVESTVLDLTGEHPTVLRPGGVTIEMLGQFLPDVCVDDAVLAPLSQNKSVRSPGMKYKHYAPAAHVTVVRGSPEFLAKKYDMEVACGKKAAILCSNPALYGNRLVFPIGETNAEMAAMLFKTLRRLDEEGVEIAFAEATGTDGMGMALMNRLLRAAGFDVIEEMKADGV